MKFYYEPTTENHLELDKLNKIEFEKNWMNGENPWFGDFCCIHDLLKEQVQTVVWEFFFSTQAAEFIVAIPVLKILATVTHVFITIKLLN